MPPLVAAAAISGIAAVGTGAIAARSQSGAAKRATEATERAAKRAEAFEREQDAIERADHARIEAEERRRFDIEQANIAREKAERDARQAYEDKLRYRKMVNLSRLTGMPTPEPLPNFAGAGGTYTPVSPVIPAGADIMSRPSTANAMIAAPFDPFTDPPRGIPLTALNRRRV